MNWNQKLKEVTEIAKEAGAAILEIYNQEDLGIEHKKDESPLTFADKAANEIICNGLNKLFPEIPIISEENKSVDYETRKNYSYFWLVDPLDGTKEFIKRNGEFTVNIALVKGNEVISGVVYTPVSNELYYATSGEGAFREVGGKSIQLSVNKFDIKDKGLGVVCSRSHLNDATQSFVEGLNSPNLIAKGSSLKFLILAAGGADIYPRLAPTMEWDTAAAQIILEEAGGRVLNNESGEKLKYNKEVLLNPHFIAYGGIS